MRTGWANSCGVELFTKGWVTCDVVVPPDTTEPPLPIDNFIYVPGRNKTQSNNDLLLLLAQSVFQIID